MKADSIGASPEPNGDVHEARLDGAADGPPDSDGDAPDLRRACVALAAAMRAVLMSFPRG